MIGQDTPGSLNEALAHFAKFLRENDYPEQIAWVEQQDIISDQGLLWVRVRSSQEACDRASQRYANGIRHGLGVSLYAVSELAGTTIAAVILPKDEDSAQRGLMPRGGLKLSAATRKLMARRVTNPLSWLVLSVRHRRSSQLFRDQYLACS